MAKNKGGREIRKPKQPKQAKANADSGPAALKIERTVKKLK